MLATLLTFLSSIKLYLYGALLAVVLGLVTLFIYRGHEVTQLKTQLIEAQVLNKQAQDQVTALSQLREQELKRKQESNQRAEQIRQTPSKDDGPVSPVLLNSLRRL